MSHETGKATLRRLADHRFSNQYFLGRGIDIGSGNDCLINYARFFPRVQHVRSWDLEDGDAETLDAVADNEFDFAVSSHCLEHLRDPARALGNWIRIIRPGAHLVITVPDEDMYEQGQWPSRFNHDHRWTFTISKSRSWSPCSINILDLMQRFRDKILVKKIELLDHWFDATLLNVDQTRGVSESAIEIVCQKL